MPGQQKLKVMMDTMKIVETNLVCGWIGPLHTSRTDGGIYLDGQEE